MVVRVEQWLNGCGADSGTGSTATWSVPTPTASSGTWTSSSPGSNRSSKSGAEALQSLRVKNSMLSAVILVMVIILR
jgi:hypothetical protein